MTLDMQDVPRVAMTVCQGLQVMWDTKPTLGCVLLWLLSGTAGALVHPASDNISRC